MYTVWTEALLGTEPGPKGLRDCKILLVGNAPLGLGSRYKDLCVNWQCGSKNL
jgi:hypothetical protein